MSMICRPRPFDTDKLWPTWTEAALFAGRTFSNQQCHFRVKLGEKPESHSYRQEFSDGPDFSMYDMGDYISSLPSTRRGSSCGSSEHDNEINIEEDTQPTPFSTQAEDQSPVEMEGVLSAEVQCSQDPEQNQMGYHAREGLSCWCRTPFVGRAPIVEANGLAMNRSCPAHPCWDQSRPVISVETVNPTSGLQHPAFKREYMFEQDRLLRRYAASVVPVVRGSPEYFAVLSENFKSRYSEEDYVRQGQTRFEVLPIELRRNVYQHAFAGDEALICTWPSPAPLPFTNDIDDDACTDPMDWGTPEKYQDLDQFDEGDDFFLPKNLLASVGVLTVNKLLSGEALQVLYRDRTLRFNSHHLAKLLANPGLCSQLRHIELEDFKHTRFLDLRPVTGTLLRNKNLQDLTIGRNMAGLFVKCMTDLLWRQEDYFDARMQMLDFEDSADPNVRIVVGPLPKLSLYHFTKAAQQYSVRGAYNIRFTDKEPKVELDRKMCELGSKVFGKD